MEHVIEQLWSKCIRESTINNYLAIWRNFNKFLIRLDKKPKLWEDCVTFFCGYLADTGHKSSTLKSYISAIKLLLKLEGIAWNDDRVILGSLIRACKIRSDVINCRLPIQKSLFEMVLFKIEHLHDKSPYLTLLYKAMFVLAYYGLMRVGELTFSAHSVKSSERAYRNQ